LKKNKVLTTHYVKNVRPISRSRSSSIPSRTPFKKKQISYSSSIKKINKRVLPDTIGSSYKKRNRSLSIVKIRGQDSSVKKDVTKKNSKNSKKESEKNPKFQRKSRDLLDSSDTVKPKRILPEDSL
jgi:hypothetical protein